MSLIKHRRVSTNFHLLTVSVLLASLRNAPRHTQFLSVKDLESCVGAGGEETLVKETTIDVLLGNLPSENGLI